MPNPPTARLAASVAVAVTLLSVLAPPIGADPELAIDHRRLPPHLAGLDCKAQSRRQPAGALLLFGRPVNGRRWTHLVMVAATAAPADREISESERATISTIDVGPQRPPARLAKTSLGSAIEWWDDGVMVGAMAAEGDEQALIAAARALVVTRSGPRLRLKVPIPKGRVKITNGAIDPSATYESLDCMTTPSEPTTMELDRGPGIDPAGPPLTVADELARTVVAGRPAWRSSRTTTITWDSRSLTTTFCMFSWIARPGVKATVLGPAPCAQLAVTAAAFADAAG